MTIALELQQLKKTYPGGVQALRGIDLQVEAGDFYALLGPNGAGKSTTIGIISSLVNKTSGRVSVFGYDLEKDVVNAKRQLGLVPQEFNFNPFETVQQIVVNQAGYYGVERKEAYIRSEKYLKQLDLWGKRNERARMLSGGMKRRLMIARALMHEPKLLILDEPTAGVDIELRRSMWGFLKDLNDKGTTIILTTHYLEEAEMLCRNIGIIQHGELVENTSMKALLAKLKSETFILDLAPKSPLPKLDGYQYRLVDTATLEVEVLRRSEKYLKQLDLWGKRNERARMLSGGMKRRLMIARALMHEPKLLILDEPTAGVDIELRRSMWGFLKDLNDKGTTIILTTHYLEEAEMLCRNIGIIQHGELVENTSMKALLAKLKSETFILDLAPKSPLPKLDGYQYRLVDTATLEVEVLREQGINSVFTQLSEQGIQVLSMRNKANRLEELFVSLVNEKQGDRA